MKYVCKQCELSGIRLWREYNTCMDYQVLRCAACACEHTGKVYPNPEYEGHSIGSLIPAVPTNFGDMPDGDVDTFWGYSSVPDDACIWWYGLDIIPGVKGPPGPPEHMPGSDVEEVP